MNQPIPSIFISYKRNEEELFIAELRRRIENMHAIRVQVQQDINMPLGANWIDEIDRRIQASFAVVVVLTEGSVQSPYVTYEWSYALGAGIGVLPILRGKDIESRVHDRLKALNWLDCTDDMPRDSLWGRLRERLRELHTRWLNRDQPPQVAACLQKMFNSYRETPIRPQHLIDHLAQHGFISPQQQMLLNELALENFKRTRR